MTRPRVLKVGSIELDVPELSSELLSIFRDDMVQVRRVPARYYWPDMWPVPDEEDHGGPLVPVQEYKLTGGLLGERLDLMGFDSFIALAMVTGIFAADRTLSKLGLGKPEEEDIIESLDGPTWVKLLRSSSEDPSATGLSSRSWLLEQINELDLMWQLRAVLLAFPGVEVVLDITEPDLLRSEMPLASGLNAAEKLRYKARMFAPTIVLTEGRTDAEFLRAALEVIYPHLTDLIRFLDYERKPEGGAGALVQNIRSFAAAGVANRIVAIFDNDTAAAAALKAIDPSNFTPGIQILRYPDYELAEEYPVLGPPAPHSSPGSISLTNINGLAGSIEIYLGRDVLAQEDGSFQPVQWTSFIQGVRQYQGEITDKAKIHEKFRVKYKEALGKRNMKQGDWEGLRLILDKIRYAAREAVHPAIDEE